MQTIDAGPRAGRTFGGALVKTVGRILPVLLVWGAGAQAQPAAPDSVWSDEECWSMVAEEPTDDGGGFVCLCWTTVEEADAYRIWRKLHVNIVVDEAGNLVQLDTPEVVWVPWARVARPEDQGPILCTVVASLDGYPTVWGVSSVQNEEDSEPTTAGDTATAVRWTGWGQVKESLRAAAAQGWRRR